MRWPMRISNTSTMIMLAPMKLTISLHHLLPNLPRNRMAFQSAFRAWSTMSPWAPTISFMLSPVTRFVRFISAFHPFTPSKQILGHALEQIAQPQDTLANVCLIRRGLLGSGPQTPQYAFSLDTLELYHRLRRRHPRLGIQPFVQTLCDLYQVCFSRALSSASMLIIRRQSTGHTTVSNSQSHSMPT